jgi:hypothetical protein
MTVRTYGSESAVVHVWADSEREALLYADRNIAYGDLDWHSDDNLEVDTSTAESYDAAEVTTDPDEARRQYGTWNLDDIPEEDDDDDDYSSSAVPSSHIARYNMGEELPA